MKKPSIKKSKQPRSALVGILASASFIFICIICFSQAMARKDCLCLQLQGTICELEKVKQSALEEKDDLLLQISSRSDKDWVEMILKKRLGVVPEGQMKVYFSKDE